MTAKTSIGSATSLGGTTGGVASDERSAVFALVAGALVWGLIWYPYRVMRDAGLDGIAAATATYATALFLGLLVFRHQLVTFRPHRRQFLALVLLALSAGGCNLGYVLAALTGEVMRVLLLFYLAPVWTVLLARVLLGEVLSGKGAAVVLLALAGAMTMLWHPEIGWPVPQSKADWLGLAAGFSFAAYNVLSRRMGSVPVEIRTLSAFVGVALIGGGLIGAGAGQFRWPGDPIIWLLIPLLGGVLMVVNLVVQFGLSRIAANRAIVIMVSELGFAALSSWWLAGESLELRGWVGGGLIVAATLLSARNSS